MCRILQSLLRYEMTPSRDVGRLVVYRPRKFRQYLFEQLQCMLALPLLCVGLAFFEQSRNLPPGLQSEMSSSADMQMDHPVDACPWMLKER